MKTVVGLVAAALLLLATGCAVETGYDGAYGGVYTEYPNVYYGAGASPAYVYPYYPYGPPYDRDHYFDRSRHWEQHRWHGDTGWGGHR